MSEELNRCRCGGKALFRGVAIKDISAVVIECSSCENRVESSSPAEQRKLIIELRKEAAAKWNEKINTTDK